MPNIARKRNAQKMIFFGKDSKIRIALTASNIEKKKFIVDFDASRHVDVSVITLRALSSLMKSIQ